MFVAFDIEVIFIYLWALVFRDLLVGGLVSMLIFVGVLLETSRRTSAHNIGAGRSIARCRPPRRGGQPTEATLLVAPKCRHVARQCAANGHHRQGREVQGAGVTRSGANFCDLRRIVESILHAAFAASEQVDAEPCAYRYHQQPRDVEVPPFELVPIVPQIVDEDQQPVSVGFGLIDYEFAGQTCQADRCQTKVFEVKRGKPAQLSADLYRYQMNIKAASAISKLR